MNPIIQIELRGMTTEESDKIREIFRALIASGGLTGVKNGRTILHFDGNAEFVGVELQYFPWRKRKNV